MYKHIPHLPEMANLAGLTERRDQETLARGVINIQKCRVEEVRPPLLHGWMSVPMEECSLPVTEKREALGWGGVGGRPHELGSKFSTARSAGSVGDGSGSDKASCGANLASATCSLRASKPFLSVAETIMVDHSSDLDTAETASHLAGLRRRPCHHGSPALRSGPRTAVKPLPASFSSPALSLYTNPPFLPLAYGVYTSLSAPEDHLITIALHSKLDEVDNKSEAERLAGEVEVLWGSSGKEHRDRALLGSNVSALGLSTASDGSGPTTRANAARANTSIGIGEEGNSFVARNWFVTNAPLVTVQTQETDCWAELGTSPYTLSTCLRVERSPTAFPHLDRRTSHHRIRRTDELASRAAGTVRRAVTGISVGPDISEILVVKKKKSRAALNGYALGPVGGGDVSASSIRPSRTRGRRTAIQPLQSPAVLKLKGGEKDKR
ncbi:hypothetical protein F5887DRAFT_916107 [Amanita rubescens]|nr:hypothetical protein F5887DRAFT_916107 [Amanita rubescens]